jgi:hypothetical protein
MTTYRLFIKDSFLDTIWEVLYFPIWWYSRGLKKTALFCWQRVDDGWRILALSILLKSFFKPMYGQRGWDACVLSLATHFLQLLWRFFLMALWTIFWLFILFLWTILPAFVVWQLMI